MPKMLFIPLRSEIVLVGSKMRLDIGRKISKDTLEAVDSISSMNYQIIVGSQKSPDDNYIEDISQIEKIATIVNVNNVSDLNENVVKVSFEGNERVKIKKLRKKFFVLDEEIIFETYDIDKYLKSKQEDASYDAINMDSPFFKILTTYEVECSKFPYIVSKQKENEKLEKNKIKTLYKKTVNYILESFEKNSSLARLKKFIDANLINAFEDGKENMKDVLVLGNFVELLDPSFETKWNIFTSKTYLEFLEKTFELVINFETFQEIDEDIDKDVRKKLDDQQKEFLLRERMKVIRKKLGEEGNNEEKIEEILNSKELKDIIPEDVRTLIKNEKAKLKSMMSSSPDANITRTYIELLSQLPWRKTQIETLDIKKAKKILDNYHYGLKDVKERIIEFIAVLINNKKQNKQNVKSTNGLPEDFEIDLNLFNKKNGVNVSTNKNPAPIITLLGPPGTGKTSLAKAIAESLNRKFVKISLGGVKDESEIRGHRRTYVGAMPGKIINAIKKSGVSNPLILLDEIDKMASDHRGDPASAMLEVLDPEQNANFQDHYLEVEYDLSKVMFLATANYYDSIPSPLLDRVELIELNSYTLMEKINIAKKHLIKKTLDHHSLDKKYFQIGDKEIEFLIKHYTLEAGVRGLQRTFDKLARKIVIQLVENKLKDEFIIDEKQIKKLLGVIKFSDEENDKEPQIGSVNGLAYTAYGGSTLAIEVTTFKGKGGLKLTGQLKDVMQESAQIALAYVRANADKYKIDFDWEENSIHIHVPEGAVPKDGPSAGITFTTAIVSALTQKPVSHLIGMTGEITLRGKVLPIGGLKEKSLAAYRLGIKTIFIPSENKRNLIDIPPEVKKAIKFIPVSHYDEVFKKIFE